MSLRILCVTPMYPEPENPRFGSFVEQQNRALAGQGVAVEVLCRRAGARGVGSYLGLGARGLASLPRWRGVDLVHAHYAGVAAAEALALARLARRPLLLTCHGSDVEAATSAWRRPFVARLLRTADGLHFVSNALRERAQELVGPLPAPTLVQPTGIDLAALGGAARPSWRRDAGRPLILLGVGLLVPRKGWVEMLEALALLGHHGRAAELWAVGDGETAWLRREAVARGVDGRLRLRGVVPPAEVPALYAEADVVLVASHREGFGLVGLEAMAAAKPLVSTNVGGMADYLEPERNALVVPTGDGPAIAAAIERLLTTPGLAERLGAAGRQTATRFESGVLARRLVDFCGTLLPRAG